MPRKAIDYSKTHFYKIVCKDLTITDCYVGHTTDFVKRKHTHKQACLNPNVRFHNLDLYKTIRENGNWDNWDMVLIGTENILNSLEARQREREYIEKLKANLNMVKAYRSKEEADVVGREFRENHKEEKKEYDKLYRENNKEKRQENYRIYRENNKDYLKTQKGLKFECERGGRYTNCHKQEHMRSKKHQEYLQSLND